MTKATRYARTSALPAIAAALALSSTTSLAQQAQPTPTEPTTTAAPTTTAPDVASPTSQPPASASDPSAQDTAPPATAAKATATAKARPTHSATKRAAAAARPAAPVVTHKSHSTTAAKSPKPSAPTAPAAPPLAAQTAAKPPVQPQTSAKASSGPNDTALEIGGGALAILALGAAAFAIARRRRSEDEEWYEEQPYEDTHGEPAVAFEEPVAAAAMPRHDPIAEEQSAIAAPDASAFSWGDSKKSASSSDDGSDRRPGETWVERAYRGPSPANPSVSLRNRLRRAAFFDKRERDVAEGLAEPVDPGAGLPEARGENLAGEHEFA